MEQTTYTYYSLLRPLAPGTCPKQNMINVVNFDDRTFVEGIGNCWGKVVYSSPVENYRDYDLKPEIEIPDNMTVPVRITKHQLLALKEAGFLENDLSKRAVKMAIEEVLKKLS